MPAEVAKSIPALSEQGRIQGGGEAGRGKKREKLRKCTAF